MASSEQTALIHLDTHIAVWLHDGLIDRFSPAACAALNAHALAISPMVELELQYLFEIGRLNIPAADMLHTLHTDLGLVVSQTSFAVVASKAAQISWTRDPFDRLIVAQAQCEAVQLLTCDERIRTHFNAALW